MNRPRRAAAQKPEGHYAGTSAAQKTSATRKTSSTRKASPTRKVTKSGATRKQRKGKNQSGGDEMDIDPTPVTAENTPGDPPEPLDPAALALDFKKSYEGAIPPPVRPKRGKRFKQPASNPITNLNDVPKGWSLYDPDLDPEDLDARIARCHERISDNIMVHQFKFDLKGLLREKKKRDDMMALEPPGLSYPVVQRLQTLKGMLAWLDSEGDQFELADNVRSLIEAYRSGQLKWNPHLVTYWAKGVQLCQPRPFRWNECDVINAQREGQKGFWVEGLQGAGPAPQQLQWMSAQEDGPDSGPFVCHMYICVKPQPTLTQLNVQSLNLSFLDDTGANMMQINMTDVATLMDVNANGNEPQLPTVLGLVCVGIADGSRTYRICMRLDINMWDEATWTWLTPNWDPIPVLVYNDMTNPPSPPLVRMNGPWPRLRMYSASAPGGNSETYFSDLHPSAMIVPTVSMLDRNRIYPAAPNLIPAPPSWNA